MEGEAQSRPAVKHKVELGAMRGKYVAREIGEAAVRASVRLPLVVGQEQKIGSHRICSQAVREFFLGKWQAPDCLSVGGGIKGLTEQLEGHDFRHPADTTCMTLPERPAV